MREIEAIFFDMAGTLRIHTHDESRRFQAVRDVMKLIGAAEQAEAFGERLDRRFAAYRRWRIETCLEASEREIWTRWMLPDWPEDRIGPLAEQLMCIWRSQAVKAMRPDAPPVVAELARRGYHMGIISNTISATETPRDLSALGLDRYFETVLLSCVFGRRKPDPQIFLEGALQLGVPPERCAYVGDAPSRDVAGPRRAGFALAIIIGDPGCEPEENADPLLRPDVLIHKFADLLGTFAPRVIGEGAY